MFFELFGAYLEGDAVGSTKGCGYYKMQCVTEVIQKLGHHAWNLCFVRKGTLSIIFFNLSGNLINGPQKKKLVEWGTFRV